MTTACNVAPVGISVLEEREMYASLPNSDGKGKVHFTKLEYPYLPVPVAQMPYSIHLQEERGESHAENSEAACGYIHHIDSNRYVYQW
jgi:hypothetical protein